MSSCTDPLGCERAHQAVVLARQAALKLMDGVAQLRIAKVGSEAILERLDEETRGMQTTDYNYDLVR